MQPKTTLAQRLPPPGGNIWEGNTGKKAPVEKHRVSRKVARTRPGCSSAVIRCTMMHLPRVPSPPRGVASPKYLCLLLTGSSVNYACVRSRSPRPMSRLRDAAGRESPFMMDKMEEEDDDSFDGNEEEPVWHLVSYPSR